MDFDLEKANASLDSARAEATTLFEMVAEFVILDDHDMVLANGILGQVKEALAAIEAKRKTITQPLNISLRAINAMFSDVAEKYATCERQLKKAIMDAEKRSQKEQDEALARVQAGEQTPATLAVAHGANVIQLPKNISTRKDLAFRIVNDDLIPRNLCSGDARKIKIALAQGIAVPGVETWYEDVVSRRKK